MMYVKLSLWVKTILTSQGLILSHDCHCLYLSHNMHSQPFFLFSLLDIGRYRATLCQVNEKKQGSRQKKKKKKLQHGEINNLSIKLPPHLGGNLMARNLDLSVSHSNWHLPSKWGCTNNVSNLIKSQIELTQIHFFKFLAMNQNWQKLP